MKKGNEIVSLKEELERMKLEKTAILKLQEHQDYEIQEEKHGKTITTQIYID